MSEKSVSILSLIFIALLALVELLLNGLVITGIFLKWDQRLVSFYFAMAFLVFALIMLIYSTYLSDTPIEKIRRVLEG